MLSEVYSRLSLFHVHVLDASDAVRNLDWAIVHWEVLNRYDPILLMMCFSPHYTHNYPLVSKHGLLENEPGDFPMKNSIYRGFSTAMFDETRGIYNWWIHMDPLTTTMENGSPPCFRLPPAAGSKG